MFKFITFVALISVGYAHSYVAHGNANAVSHVTLGSNAAYQPQPIYAKHQSYSYPQYRSSGLSNQLPYNLPEDFADSELEHPIYYNAKQASYSYPQKTITVLPTLYIPAFPSYAPSANSYQSHHPADIQNVDAQPSYYPSTSATQSVLPSQNSGYTVGSSDLYNSNSRPSGSIFDIN